MNQSDLPFDEQTAGLTPALKATHRRLLVRQRQKIGPRSRWWFEQMRREVDRAPEPTTAEPKKQT